MALFHKMKVALQRFCFYAKNKANVSYRFRILSNFSFRVYSPLVAMSCQENVNLTFHFWFVFVVTFRVKYTCVCVFSVCISSGSAARCVCRIPQLRPGAGECFHDWSLLTHIRYTDPWNTWFWLVWSSVVKSVNSLFVCFFLSSYTS